MYENRLRQKTRDFFIAIFFAKQKDWNRNKKDIQSGNSNETFFGDFQPQSKI